MDGKKAGKRIKNCQLSDHDDKPSQIPSIEDQLKSLQPTRELLGYYRSKLELHQKEYELFIEKVKRCKILCEEDKISRDEIIQLNEEVFTLQKALSDLKVYLHQERNQVLKLHSENDMLKIQLAKDRKIINFLLNLCGTSEDHVYYLMNRSDQVDSINQSHEWRKGKDDTEMERLENYKDPEILRLQVCALNCQLEELMKVSKDEIHSLHQDRELAMLEREREHENLQNKIKMLNDRLKKTQINLCNSTKEILEFKMEYSRKEEAWLLEKVAYRQGKSPFKEKHEDIAASAQSPQKLKYRNEVKEQLQKKDYIIKQYKDQCASLEKQLWDLTNSKVESHNVQQEKLEHLSKELCRLKEKYAVLCHRKALEAEGFRNDVKILKEHVRSLERKFVNDDRSMKVCQKKEMLDTTKAILATTKLLQKELKSYNELL